LPIQVTAIPIMLPVLGLRCVRIPGIAVGRIPGRPGSVLAVFVMLARVPGAMLLEDLLREVHPASLRNRDDRDHADG
jgi:hypothetical protein